MRMPSGVIQISLLPGLLLLALVIAALAILSKLRSTAPDAAASNMQAMAILVQGSSIQTALIRARGDGVIDPKASGIVNLGATLMTTPLMTKDIFPQPPAQALSRNSQWVYAQQHFQTLDAQAPPMDLGSEAKDDVLYLPHLTAVACAHINHRLFGASTRLDPKGRYPVTGHLDETAQRITGPHGLVGANSEAAVKEGCVAYSDSSYTYYKVIGVN